VKDANVNKLLDFVLTDKILTRFQFVIYGHILKINVRYMDNKECTQLLYITNAEKHQVY
jgi:hypothetical protein